MNPDSDATAIWLERKFDVPESGHWVSETIFSISPTKDPTAPNFPGLIVFECSPLEGIVDDLERLVYLLPLQKGRLNFLSRKYRVLDDCSRLRDIIQAFPQHRYFRPSILVLSWVEGEKAEVPADLLDMVCHPIYNFTWRLI